MKETKPLQSKKKRPYISKQFSEAQLLENNGKERLSYDSTLLPPSNLAVFGSKLSLKIIEDLVKEPGCAMDIARNLGEHEQKIYYHIRRLEKAGIVKLKSKEKRYGMIANIFGVVSPVVATKLYDNGHTVRNAFVPRNPKAEKFLHPFIDNGKMNCIVVLGDPYSHGRFDKGGREGAHVFNLSMMMGSMLNNMDFSENYKFDTNITESDLKNNLILIGNVQTNVLIDRINKKLPAYFDEKRDWAIVSRETGNRYGDPRTGIVIKMDSPFHKGKKILILGGKTRATKAAILACTKYLNNLIENEEESDNLVRIVRGFDQTGNTVIDSIKVLE